MSDEPTFIVNEREFADWVSRVEAVAGGLWLAGTHSRRVLRQVVREMNGVARVNHMARTQRLRDGVCSSERTGATPAAGTTRAALTGPADGHGPLAPTNRGSA